MSPPIQGLSSANFHGHRPLRELLRRDWVIELEGAPEVDDGMNEIWMSLMSKFNLEQYFQVSITCIHPIKDIVCSLITLEQVLAEDCRHTFPINFLFKESQEVRIVIIASKTFTESFRFSQVRRLCKLTFGLLNRDLIADVVLIQILYLFGTCPEGPEAEKMMHDVV